MERQGGRCWRLVLVPFPLQGHISPMLQLGTILHSRGFSITIAHTTNLGSPDASKHPDFVFLPLSSDDSSSTTESKDSDDFIVFVSDLNLNHRASLQEQLTEMVEKREQHEELPCIVYDTNMYSAETVARHLKLPSIMLCTSSASSMIAYYAYPQLLEEGCISLQGPESEELVPGLHPLRFKDLPVFDFKNPDTLLQLEASLLALSQKWLQLPPEEDHSCITWLDKQTDNSVIYVSFGSISSLDEKELAEIAWSLANSKQPFLWVVRPGSVGGSESIDVLLSDDFKGTVGERGCIVKWAPQKEVLAHRAVGGFWSHCGWNSTLESISEGGPLICRPFFADQRVNARYISREWRVGIDLENDLKRVEIERAIKMLMLGKEGQEMRQRATHLKTKAGLCIKEGGSSFNSLNKLVELIILAEGDHNCITWLNKQTENSAYASFGSIRILDENELAEIAWCLANSKQPFLWVLRPGSVHDQILLIYCPMISEMVLEKTAAK
ncbi:hypothetical protein JRO89_XS13G0111600 [Xanthoceras sorbifolium]|uniref:UDP-glucose iridoid glucosyltransferase-like n=1 Tax=Xanthoceras sorbifolium TaxID=99658 RepID=A0ABQ8H7U3_9ROSI|nr:hypothetical protein JRO89_XS13G0111600 [Xanthoceras sorbifolium]